MNDEKIIWRSETAPDGRELVTFGTPSWPVGLFGPWNSDLPQGGIKTVIPWHWHDELELNVVYCGKVEMMADGKVWEAAPGQGLFVNSGVMHRTDAADESNYFSLIFSPWIVGGAPGSVFWQQYLTPMMSSPECRAIPLTGSEQWEKDVSAIVLHIAEVWRAKPFGYEFEVRDGLSKIILSLCRNCLHSAPAPSERELRNAERIKKMLTFVQDNFAEKITTEQIAASAAVSVSECLRCFRSMLNSTPKAYLRQYRVQRAAQLLEFTDKPVADIGAECGFDDMSYFARVFRAEQGTTPSEFREKHAGKAGAQSGTDNGRPNDISGF